mmetsp:Transcript_3080/g.6547  ORF Transcript_3080/g.6547 Transcript_3080/m.6547 type:complete len:320 (-) Transcript_3080:93-1052(-)
MFLNNPAATRSILSNNVNTMQSGQRPSKTLPSDSASRRMPFNENLSSKGLKTPHRNKEALASNTNTQRRRALGDISNRKPNGGGINAANAKSNGSLMLKPASKKSGVELKPFSSISGNAPSGNKKSGILPAPSSSLGYRFQQTNTPKLKLNNGSKTRSGPPENFILPNRTASTDQATPKTTTTTSSEAKSTTSEYDGIFGKTTRWAQPDLEYEKFGSAFQITEEELNGVSKFRQERFDRIKKETFEEARAMIRDADEDWKRREREFMEKEWESFTIVDRDVPVEFDFLAELNDDDEVFFDLMEERRLSGTDPLTLCGEI